MSDGRISQIGATAEGVVFLRKLAGRLETSGAKRDEEAYPTAPFEEMKDAYRSLFVFGLLNGERMPPKKGQTFSTIYSNINMLSESFDFSTLLSAMGAEEDLEDIGKSVNEYTNWAIEFFRNEYSPETFNILPHMGLDSEDDGAGIFRITRK